jgi:hypothetical protein
MWVKRRQMQHAGGNGGDRRCQNFLHDKLDGVCIVNLGNQTENPQHPDLGPGDVDGDLHFGAFCMLACWRAAFAAFTAFAGFATPSCASMAMSASALGGSGTSVR